MLGSDFLFGWLVAQFLKKDEQPSAPRARPRPPGVPPAPPPPPGAAPSSPAAPPAPSSSAAAPAMPVNVVVPPAPTSAPEGFLKAVEVWQVRPDVAMQASAIAGAAATPLALAELERAFPKGWRAATVVSAQEAETAKALTKQWTDGRVMFMGPATLLGRRAYRMTKHPKHAPAAPAPIPVAPVEPAPTIPASIVTPAPAVAPPPVVHPAVIEQMQPPPPPPAFIQAAKAARQILTVRKSEGLAQIAKRAGRPESAQSAMELRAANVPNGPDAQWESKSLNAPERGLKKVGRPGGVQPGDHLFVPPEWGQVDPARL